MQYKIIDDIPTERSVIASALSNDSALLQLNERLIEEDFSDERNRRWLKQLVDHADRGETPDVMIIAEKIGDIDYAAELLTTATEKNISAKIERLQHARACRDIVRRAYDVVMTGQNVTDYKEFADDSAAKLQELTVHTGGGKMQCISNYRMEAIDNLQKALDGELRGITTGIADLDADTNGFMPGESVIIAARPGVGKTSTALSIMKHNSSMGKKGAIYSLEMPGAQLVNRLSSMFTSIPLRQFRGVERPSKEAFAGLSNFWERMENLGIYVNDYSLTTMRDIMAQMQMFCRSKPIDYLIIDHVGLIRPDANMANKKRHEQVMQFSLNIKALAKILGVPIFTLVQLHRDTDNRPPKLRDLSESSQLEKDADCVLAMHKPDPDDQQRIMMLGLKGRDFKKGNYPLTFNTDTTEVQSMDHESAHKWACETEENNEQF